MKRLLVAVLVMAGVVQLGSAAYIPAKAALAQVMLDQAWQRSGNNGGQRHRPWPWADTWPVARLRSAKYDVDLVVLAGMTGRSMAFGPAHMSASALPGNIGNSVIGGHRDTHFAFLEKLQPGDRLLVERANGEEHWFRVTGLEILDSNIDPLVLPQDGRYLTLITCYPFDAIDPGGPLRYVVTAERIDEHRAVSVLTPAGLDAEIGYLLR